MNVYERIVELLKQEPALQDFKYVKSKHAFVKRVDGIRYAVYLDHHFVFNIRMCIRPSADVRFDVLHKWFEKFSFKTIKDQRYNATVGLCGSMVGFDDIYYFEYDGSDFDEVYLKFREAVLTCMEVTFTTFATMEDFYRAKVLPVIENKEQLPLLGADWFFEYLTACRILHPESYDKLKKIAMEHVAGRMRVGEPNIMEYEGKWDEILEYLESLDFSSGKARKAGKKAGKKTSSKDTASPK